MWPLFKKECLLAFRNRGELANPLIFFVMVVTLLPLGIGPESDRLSDIAAGMIWVVALLASLLSVDKLFRSDYDDGSLEQLLLRPGTLVFPVLIKVFCHWLVSGLPLAFIAPLLALMLSLPLQGFFILWLSLLLGTACFSLVGAIGAALTVSLRHSGLLLPLVVMPFYIPVLIFGSAAVHNSVAGLNPWGSMAVVGAFLAVSVALAPLAIIMGLRISVED